jgi:hypothetical protein
MPARIGRTGIMTNTTITGMIIGIPPGGTVIRSVRYPFPSTWTTGPLARRR